MAYLETHGLGRDFPGVTALNGVDISVELGCTHVLAGENGAGKSTLVKILTGTDQASRGTVLIDGQDPVKNPALYKNVAYVPQEISLFPQMSVAENLFIPFDRTGHGGLFVDRRALVKQTQTYLERFGIDADPRALVADISVPDQQLLQIARACTHADMKVLILDEPTSSLTRVEVERVFKVIRSLLDRDHAIVFISHKMDEVFAIGDDYTVLRNGERIESGRVSAITEADLIRAMSGRDISVDADFRPKGLASDIIMEVNGLCGARFQDVSFTLRRGEILGFAGLVGAGRSELMQTLFGFLKARAGTVTFEGTPWTLNNPSTSVASGMLYLPEERKQHGIFPLLSLRENIGLATLSLTQGLFGINSRGERELVQKIIDTYGIRTSSMGKRIAQLSGGNQQKAIIGRAMATRPRVLIFDEPTKGIDIRTKTEIYKIMQRLAEEGVGIILVSSELDELKKCASRIVTMHRGRITNTFNTVDTSHETLVAALFDSDIKTDGK